MSITHARLRCCAGFVLLVAGLLGLNASGGAADAPLGGRTNANVLPQVEAIDTWIRQGWQASSVRPSPAAEDGEYCRRVFLDLMGRVPTVAELRQYEGDRSPQKQRRLVQRLLNDEAYRAERVRYWAVLWTNLLIGRAGSESRDGFVSREGMAAYLEEAFAENRPYDRMVYELIAATGANRPAMQDGAASRDGSSAAPAGRRLLPAADRAQVYRLPRPGSRCLPAYHG